MTPRPLTAQERGLILLVAIGLVVTGVVFFISNYLPPSPSTPLSAPIDITGVRVLVPTFLDTDGSSKRVVNLNTASATELTALPGIGEVLAARIVDYRKEHGPFRTVEELKAVSGIGNTLVERIRDTVTLEINNGED